ncbi:MAG: polysaccharide biosynthesis tyrosine autokinase [Bacteroidia bacterium]|nr:polysaccharide biosynthesis tyrosine autokinase [Bacteroidia bacterium]
MNNPVLHKANNNLIDQRDIKRTINLFLKNWYWFALFIFLGAAGALLFLKKSTNYYGSTSMVLIKPQKSAFKALESNNLALNSEARDEISNEMKVLGSRKMLNEAIQRLDLDISFYVQGQIKTGEVYKNVPFKVDGKLIDKKLYGALFEVTIIDKNRYRLHVSGNDWEFDQELKFGQTVNSKRFNLILTANDNAISSNQSINEVKYMFSFHERNFLIDKYSKALKISSEDGASIMKLNLEDAVELRAVEFLDTLTKIYIENSISQNKEINANTLAYLDNEINIVSNSLNNSENTFVNMITSTGSVGLGDQNREGITQSAELDAKLRNLQIELDNINMLSSLLDDDDQSNLAAIANILQTQNNPGLLSAFDKLQRLNEQRQALLFNQTPSSPAVKDVDALIATVKSTINGTVINIRKTLAAQINSLRSNIGQINQKVSSTAYVNRGLQNVKRSVDLNERMFLFLMETRAQTMIARSAIVADKFILEPARSQGLVHPLPSKVLITGIGIGLAFAFLVIFFKNLYLNYIITKDDLKEITHLPIVGIVAKAKEGEKEYNMVDKYPQSPASEAFRVIRTNLSYYKTRVVVFTSSVAGEGKTFCAINTATILAKSKKKVLIIDCDLHKPKQANAFNLNNDIGITSYLAGKNDINSIIKPTGIENLSIILSGPRTPNASELLLDPSMNKLMDDLMLQFDYIIIDSAPVGLISDSLELMKYADLTLFVLKANYSKRDFVDVAHQITERNPGKSVGFILNSVSAKNVSAGYGGGYYK